MRRFAFIAVLLLAVMLAFMSCDDHKHVVCPGGKLMTVSVVFSWANAPEADPAGMTLYFFPTDQRSKLWRFDIAGREGGQIELPTGNYRMLAFNNDLPGVRIDGTDSFDGIRAAAVEIAGERVRPTGMLYGAVISGVEVTPCGVTYITEQGKQKSCPFGIMRCAPDSLSTCYKAIFRNVKGLERVRSAKVTLCGIAGTLYLANGKSDVPEVATSFGLEFVAGSSLSGQTTGFGLPPGDAEVSLSLSVTRVDGSSLSKKFDVTSQVLNCLTPKNVTIIIEGIEIPAGDIPPEPPDSPDIGINVGVDGWTAINVDISTNLP